MESSPRTCRGGPIPYDPFAPRPSGGRGGFVRSYAVSRVGDGAWDLDLVRSLTARPNRMSAASRYETPRPPSDAPVYSAATLNHRLPFAEEAGRVPGTKPQETIYAITCKPGGAEFPLVWAPDATIHAENVTKRYALALAKAQPRLMAEVVAVNAANGDQCLRGRSLGPHADVNLHLSAPVKEGETYKVTAVYKGETVTQEAKVAGDTVVRIDLDAKTRPFDARRVEEYLSGNSDHWDVTERSVREMAFDERSAKAAWEVYLNLPSPRLKADFDADVAKTADRTSRYLWKKVGEKPAGGWPLVIVMHGGGGARRRRSTTASGAEC